MPKKTYGNCFYCGVEMIKAPKRQKGNGADFNARYRTLDHVIPRAMAGIYPKQYMSYLNIVYACMLCNNKKASHSPIYWLTTLDVVECRKKFARYLVDMGFDYDEVRAAFNARKSDSENKNALCK